MLILGIGDHLHDPSVCLMQDDKIIAAIEYERLSRIRHGIKINTDNYKIHTMGNYFKDLLEKTTITEREDRYRLLTHYCLETLINCKFSDIDLIVSSSLFDTKAFTGKAIHINHHLAHAASTFYSSTFNESAILVIDGHGHKNKKGYETVSSYQGNGQHIALLDKTYGSSILSEDEKSLELSDTSITLENSLGALYKNITVLIGFGHFSEGTTMAFAAYGIKDPIVYDVFEKHILLLNEGAFAIDNRSIYFEITHLLLSNNSDAIKANIAFALQMAVEKVVLHLCQHLSEKTRLKSLCLAGGFFLNCPANTRILRETSFENVFIQPSCGDSGIAIGCAQYGAFTTLKIKRHFASFNPYLGKSYSLPVETHKNFHKVSEHDQAIQQTASLINAGKIVGWYNGGSEIGPRALGNRSILADPRRAENKDKLNTLKGREYFRPLAPAVLLDHAHEYFDMDFESPYMLFIAHIKEKYQPLLTAIAHHDGSARVQTVTKELNPTFYDLIETFYDITGIPILINTSFNGKNEPIVETVEDAIACATRIGLDAIYINGSLYKKS